MLLTDDMELCDIDTAILLAHKPLIIIDRGEQKINFGPAKIFYIMKSQS